MFILIIMLNYKKNLSTPESILDNLQNNVVGKLKSSGTSELWIPCSHSVVGWLHENMLSDGMVAGGAEGAASDNHHGKFMLINLTVSNKQSSEKVM